jgi:L-ascorbate metabolism protein UlaG (beta-lactamase superfamily)
VTGAELPEEGCIRAEPIGKFRACHRISGEAIMKDSSQQIRFRPYVGLAQLRMAFLALFLAFLPAYTAFAQKQLQEDTVKISSGDLKITCIGHASVMFAFGGKVIHVDPVSSMGDYTKLPKADLILITHEHGDHLDLKAVQAVITDQTVIAANAASAKILPKAIVINNGETKILAGFKIEAVPAYNMEKNYHPKGNGNGYIIAFGDTRVYVAGDTENTPELKSLKQIDIAFLPINLPFTMTPEMVADATKALRPKILYPYHFGSTDTSVLVNLLKDEKGIEVRIRDMK